MFLCDLVLMPDLAKSGGARSEDTSCAVRERGARSERAIRALLHFLMQDLAVIFTCERNRNLYLSASLPPPPLGPGSEDDSLRRAFHAHSFFILPSAPINGFCKLVNILQTCTLYTVSPGKATIMASGHRRSRPWPLGTWLDCYEIIGTKRKDPESPNQRAFRDRF